MLDIGQSEIKENKNNVTILFTHVHAHKLQCFIRTLGTDNTDNLTCEIIYDNFTCENYRFSNNHQS